MTTETSNSPPSKASSMTAVAPSEDTPLLGHRPEAPRIWPKSVIWFVLFTAFLVSLSFGITQVPLIYVFGVMTCDDYFESHPEPGPGLPRCQNHAIEASTARAVALLGASTTLFGVINLFFTGWTIKVWGLKKALLITVFWPAVRLIVQTIGVETGAAPGIIIIQCSQILTVVGGPAGYLLALNSFAAEVVEPAERTATLGRLTGFSLFGTAIGFLLGGIISDAGGIVAPFRVAIGAFLLCTLYVLLALPSVPLNKSLAAKTSKSLSTFFDPLKMFVPRKWQLPSGKVQREYGTLIVGVGVFLGILATGYIPVLLQMYATDAFQFTANHNGWLISINCLIRGLFLTLAFPAIISTGRKWLDARHDRKQQAKGHQRSSSTISAKDIETLRSSFPAPHTNSSPMPPVPPTSATDEPKESFAFDLHYIKFSLFADGVITALATFITKPWHVYLFAAVVPLAAGAGSAAKGTILQMCEPERRADALGAISLVEMLARLSTTGLFGLIFSAFAAKGVPGLTFAVNGAFALVAFGVMLFARFPPEGAVRFTEIGDPEDES
ncbi:hypothetical protein B0A48_04493 [Cryoendolithus antarcticus]|uniref:Major facilitator superfamily (MFS) profile domain-containing protein n=1 Tax=Cryoendolithus antarcticus TaxID=1507870 RepID=A0A1V8TFI1_9PEZI|nr:hypothetical protein B0A48_04493 [Cryoendolithus antarcticus]